VNLKNFRWNIVLRVILILALSLALIWALTFTEWFFTPLVLAILLVVVVINLIYYTERTNKDLTQFLISIKQGGFTNKFTGQKRGLSQAGLSKAFNDVIREFQKISMEKESQYLYLQTLNENIGVSIISFNAEGEIQFMNPAAKALFKKPYIRSVEEFKGIDHKLYNNIQALESGEKRVIKTFMHGEMQQLSVQAKDFVLQQKDFRLVLLQNINAELEQKEVDAWQKLISVLTHEIMNSVTPIVSLSTAVNEMLENTGRMESLSYEQKDDILISLKTIENRSQGLIHFVNAYKNFSKVPELRLTDVDLRTLIERIAGLLGPDLHKAGITLNLDLKEAVRAKVDHELFEQVFINLIKNAIEALNGREKGHIEISARHLYGNRISITVADNGPGISEEVLEKMFIPFYTTRKNGTGIGLSFARQIMKLHNGNISVKTEWGKGTIFTLTLQ